MVATPEWSSNFDGSSSVGSIAVPYPEWGEPASGGPIRQGDVLSAVASDTDEWHQLLVVITADCDLAHAKHGGALTCVPIITLPYYLIRFRIEKTRESLQRRLIDAILDCLRHPGDRETEARISPKRMLAWLAEDDQEEIMASLDEWVSDTKISDLLRVAQGIIRLQEASLSLVLDRLAAVKVYLGDAKDDASARSKLASDLASTLKDLPGDILFLNEISAIHNEGYVVYLRRVVEVADASVATAFSRIPHNAQYVRVSRLRSPYIYALTQQFATVFSAIGLPTSYEEARECLSARIKSGDYQ